MSEEVKIKISQPMFEVGELEVFDNNIHSIVEKYSKIQLHEKEQILTQRIIIKQEEEIEELKTQLQQKENIIDKALYWLSENTHYTSLDAKELVLDNGINLKELLDILDKGE